MKPLKQQAILAHLPELVLSLIKHVTLVTLLVAAALSGVDALVAAGAIGGLFWLMFMTITAADDGALGHVTLQEVAQAIGLPWPTANAILAAKVAVLVVVAGLAASVALQTC